MLQAKVIPATLEQVIEIRYPVLRAGQPKTSTITETDQLASSQHFAAEISNTDGKRILVASASVHFEPNSTIDAINGWRIRGMATLDPYRSQGLGGSLIDACKQYVLKQGGDSIWCNARIGAVNFYQRHGFEKRSDLFEIDKIGDHYVMAITLKNK